MLVFLFTLTVDLFFLSSCSVIFVWSFSLSYFFLLYLSLSFLLLPLPTCRVANQACAWLTSLPSLFFSLSLCGDSWKGCWLYSHTNSQLLSVILCVGLKRKLRKLIFRLRRNCNWSCKDSSSHLRPAQYQICEILDAGYSTLMFSEQDGRLAAYGAIEP